LAALNEAAAEAASSKTATLIGAAVGGIVFIFVAAFVVYKFLERRRMRDQRLRRMKTFMRNMEHSNAVYGMNPTVVGRPTQRVRELRGKN
jgi:flagellar biogenesis protein FliO